MYMEKTVNGKKLSLSDLEKSSGGNIIRMTYYVNYGTCNEKKSDIYYVPKNGKYYLNSSVAKEVDKEFGGKGVISDVSAQYYDAGMPYLEDNSNYSWQFNDSVMGKG